MRRTLLVALAVSMAVSFCYGMGSAQDRDAKIQEEAKKEDLTAISDEKLEARLQALNQELQDLNMKASYMETEAPMFEDSSYDIERTGMLTRPDSSPSNLVGQQAAANVQDRIAALQRQKGRIEKELANRGI